MPTWYTGAVALQWIEIPSTNLSGLSLSVNPGPSAQGMLDAWGGMSLDRRTDTAWMLAPGGHGDFYGNPVLKIVLSNNSPSWIEQLASDSSPPNPNTNSRYANTSRPASAHCYYTQQFIEARNWACRFTLQGRATDGGTTTTCEAFDSTASVGANGWQAANTIPSAPAITYPGATVVKNSATEDVYLFDTNAGVYKWTQTSNTWSANLNGSPPIASTETAAAYDTTRNRILLLAGAESDVHHTFTISGSSFASQTLTGGSAGDLQGIGMKNMAMVYVPGQDAFYARKGASGGTVYRIDASTFAVTTPTTSSGGSIPVAAGSSPTGTQFVQNRWQYSSTLDGIYYLPTWSGNMWFLPLSNDGGGGGGSQSVQSPNSMFLMM
jgi:hypothetical protein